MNKYLIIFIIVSCLAVGSILVYAKSVYKPEKGANNTQSLYNFDGQKVPQQAEGQITTAMTQPQITKLEITDEKVGTGSAVKAGDTVEVNYLGTLLDGKKFDSSYDRNETFEFTVGGGEVIQGWDEGLVGMKVGGKRILVIPSDMAYGERGAGGIIGPNSPLKFEIELVAIK